LCSLYNSDGSCRTPAPRDAASRIQVDPKKFPNGMKALTDYVHSLSLKIGIYTAVSATTCGGYSASLNFEAIDAQAFADWGFDFVKHDTCNFDCGIHTRCLQNSTARMRDGLNATGRNIVYYIDDGNPSSGPRVHNPFLHHSDLEELKKIALIPEELVWHWGPETAHMWKSWFDLEDTWQSTLDNIHHQVGLEMYQKCGGYNTPDMLTVGQGSMSQGQYRAQFFIWSVLAAPLILGNDIRRMNNFTTTLLMSPEIIAVDQDPQCVQATQARFFDGWEVWIKPLFDGSFAAVLLNTATDGQPVRVRFNGYESDFWPAGFSRANVRDLWTRRDLGTFSGSFVAAVPGHDAMIVKITPV